MAKLTDSQLIILSAAAQRDGGAILPLPKALKCNKAAAATVLKSLLKHGLAAERPAGSGEDVWRKEGETKVALIVTEAGLQALNGGSPGPAAKRRRKPSWTSQKAATASTRTEKTKDAPPRPATKLGQLIALLNRKAGASIAEAMEATGWQAHSVRGAISGALKKKMQLTVTSEQAGERGRVYRIINN